MELMSSNCNNELITLHSIQPNIKKYAFLHNNSLYVSYKDLVKEKEYLIKIAHISNVKTFNKSSMPYASPEGNDTEHKNENEECEMFINLSQNMNYMNITIDQLLAV